MIRQFAGTWYIARPTVWRLHLNKVIIYE